MPTYEFIDTSNNEIFEKSMKISELDSYLAENPTHQRHHSSAPPLGDPVRLGIRKVDNGFKEVLHKISERAPGAKGLKDHIR
jgi:hypothetical protein